MTKKVSYYRRTALWVYVVLLGFAFLMLYPFWNAVVISLNDGTDTLKGGITFWPRAFTLENYRVVLKDSRIFNSFLVAVARTVIGTVLSVFCTSIFAYAMSRNELMGRRFYMVVSMITLYFSGGLIPYFMLIKNLGMLDNFSVLVVPGIISVWNMIIFRTFFRGIPAGLVESARLDGCGNWRIFFRIVLPLSGPVIATLGLFTAVYLWNDWFTPSIFINNPDLMPIQTKLNEILSASTMTEQMKRLDPSAAIHLASMRSVTTKSLSMATMVVSTLPILCVYPFVQKYFVKGVLIGSLKE